MADYASLYDMLLQQAGTDPNATTTGFTGTLDPNQFRFAPAPTPGANVAFDPSAYNFNAGSYGFQAPQAQALQGFQPPPAFQAPSGQAALANDPGYQFRIAQGQRALEAGAAARGGLLSGGAQKALVDYGQQAGSQEYQNAYNRALGENQLAYSRALGENQLAYGRGYQQNQDAYNQALAQNQLMYNRDLAANQLNYSRGYQLNQDINTRGLAADQLAYNRGLSQNQMDYERNLGANQTWYNRALQDYMTNYNTQLGQRQQSWNELMGLANLGLGAQGQLTSGGQLYGQQAAGNITGAGSAEAAGTIGAANVLNTGLAGVGGAANSYLQNQLLAQILANRAGGSSVYGGGGAF